MNWRAEAISKLKEYPARKQATAGLPAEIQRVELQYQAARDVGSKDAALDAAFERGAAGAAEGSKVVDRLC